MSGADKRLDRLLPALSAKERALLVLRHYKERTVEDPAISMAMPNDQAAAFNRYVRLMGAVNMEIACVLLVLKVQVEQLDLKYGWLLSLLLYGTEVSRLGEGLLAATKDRRLRRDIRKLIAASPGEIEFPVDLLTGTEGTVAEDRFGQGIVRALLTGIRDGVQRYWRELRSVEVAVAEVAEEFDGEDPLRPDNRALLDGAKALCVKLHDDVEVYVEPFELEEPAEDETDLARRLIAKAAQSS